jgi:hypothetical protein
MLLKMEPAIRVAQELQSLFVTTASINPGILKTAAVHAPAGSTGGGVTQLVPGLPEQVAEGVNVYPLPSSSSSSLCSGFVVLSSFS